MPHDELLAARRRTLQTNPKLISWHIGKRIQLVARRRTLTNLHEVLTPVNACLRLRNKSEWQRQQTRWFCGGASGTAATSQRR
ncbi:hypothetical protein QL285_025958 [Trifolium repens]|nr:hypothetical protein QL285_025958 [Trifolium repens]